MAAAETDAAATIKVRQIEVMREARWAFDDNCPKWRHQPHGSVTTFDPFPAYPHDMDVVRETAAHVARMFPPLWDVDLVVADREFTSRCNAHAGFHQSGHYEAEKWVKDPPVGLIILSGKRIPPHPAVSRYLVGHEYGHNVQNMLEIAGGGKHGHEDKVLTEYAQMRGMALPIHHGSGGSWHDSAAEVFACDFRVVVCDVETSYWPHPGIPHPHQLDVDLSAWWTQAHTIAAEWKPPSNDDD